MLDRRTRTIIPAFSLLLMGAGPDDAGNLSYVVSLSETAPTVAQFELTRPAGLVLVPARSADAGTIEDLRCGDSPVPFRDGRWTIPANCRALRWRVRLADLDRGVDASVPPSGWSAERRFWFLAERHGWIRPPQLSIAGSVTFRISRVGGEVAERVSAFPSGNEPPFYAAIGFHPTRVYQRGGLQLAIYGQAPDFSWVDTTHDQLLAIWARWRDDLIPEGVATPPDIALAWLPTAPDMEPGYNASAGASVIGAQIVLREGDPDAERKARAVILASGAHEGFHSITGAGAQAWPAWVNESLANYFAIEAARGVLAPDEFTWIERFYVDPRLPGSLLSAQQAYSAGDGEQRHQFYTKGARFWAEIERVLTVSPNGSGSLAALIRESRNFAGVNLTDAEALAAFLDRHSEGGARAIVDCFLVRQDCDAPLTP